MNTRLLSLLFFLTGIIHFAQAFENDLQAICKRPGTNELFVGGEFHTLMVIDANTGATVRQFELTHNVMDMQFDPSGKTLIVYDGGAIHFLNPDDGLESSNFEASQIRLIAGSPYIVDRHWMGDKLEIYSSTDGSKIASFAPGFSVMDYGFSSDFSELIVLGSSTEIKNEKALLVKTIEKQESYNVFNSAYCRQQDDGEGAGFAVYNMQSNSTILNTFIPYSTSNSFDFLASKYGDHYYLTCWDMLLKIDAAGKATPIESSESSFTYASGTDASGRFIFLTDTKSGTVYNCADGSQVKFDAREDFEFSYTVDLWLDKQHAYMLSDDFSIIQLDMQGKVLKRLKIERTSGNGFGVYYTNGFNKKEARDKEAAIINQELEALGLPVIDLETKVGDSNVLLSVFGSMKEAEAFQQKLDANGLQYITKIAPIAEE